MAKRGLSVYFIHSNQYDFNSMIYLPCLRSSVLANHTLVFPESEENKTIYYRDLMDKADVFVIELTCPDNELNLQIKYAVMTKKPILALAQREIGYDEKYQKLLQNVIGYSTEDEIRSFVETFVNTYKDKINGGKMDQTVILGVLN